MLLIARRTHGSKPAHIRIAGFSLLELAITLAVVTVLLGGLLVPLSTQIAQRNESATQRQLDDIKEALLGFAAANGRLPCPATGSTGAESFDAVNGGDATNGDCGTPTGGAYIGFLPALTLGLSQLDSSGFAVDAWGNNPHNRIRYAVSSDALNSQDNPFTKAGGMRAATMSWVASAELLHVCASGSGVTLTGTGWHCTATGDATNTLTYNAPVVIWSTAANSSTGGSSTDEVQNPNPNSVTGATSLDRIFVSHTRSGSPEFDDIVTWMSPGRLVNRMIVSGQLP